MSVKKLLVSATGLLALVLAFGLASAGTVSADNSPTYDIVCVGPYAGVTIHWTPASGALAQYVDVSPSSDFATVTQQAVSGTTTNATWNYLLANTTYYWRVKSAMPSGYVYSQVFSFTPCTGPQYYYPIYPTTPLNTGCYLTCTCNSSYYNYYPFYGSYYYNSVLPYYYTYPYNYNISDYYGYLSTVAQNLMTYNGYYNYYPYYSYYNAYWPYSYYYQGCNSNN